MLLVKKHNSSKQSLRRELQHLAHQLQLHVLIFDVFSKENLDDEMLIFFLDHESRLQIPLLQEELCKRKIKLKMIEVENYGI